MEIRRLFVLMMPKDIDSSQMEGLAGGWVARGSNSICVGPERDVGSHMDDALEEFCVATAQA